MPVKVIGGIVPGPQGIAQVGQGLSASICSSEGGVFESIVCLYHVVMHHVCCCCGLCHANAFISGKCGFFGGCVVTPLAGQDGRDRRGWAGLGVFILD